MTNETFTSSAEITPEVAEQVVYGMYDTVLETSSIVQKVRDGFSHIMTTVGTDGVIGDTASTLEERFEEATNGGNGTMKLEDDLGAGVLGQNTMGTNDSVVLRDQLSPEAIIVDARSSLDTVLHENDPTLGHAGQDPTAWSTVAVVTPETGYQEPTTMIEGNVVANVSAHIGEVRKGLPQETYLVGLGLTRELGEDTVDSYLRKGGANVGNFIQVEFWERNPNLTLEQMLEEGAAVGMPVNKVLEEAAKLGKIPQGTPVSHPALAA